MGGGGWGEGGRSRLEVELGVMVEVRCGSWRCEEVGSGEDGVPLMSGDEEDGDGVEVGGKRGDDIPPPPYQAPAPASMSISTSTPPAQAPASQPQPASESVADSWLTPKKPEIEYTSAHLFVIGTSLLLLTIISLMLSALCIQAACFCGPG